MDVVYRTGTQSEDDPTTFVMSDGSVDRMGDIIEADGWQLKDFRSNPIALFGHDSSVPIGLWKSVRVEGGRLLGKLQLAAQGTSEFIDVLHKLIDQRILRAVSVGFRPLKYEPLDKDNPWGGFRFTKQELVECSLVSVPANPNALALSKSLGSIDQLRLFAKSGRDEVTPFKPNSVVVAKSGSRSPAPTGARIMNIAERIRESQEELTALRDQLLPLARKFEEQDALEEDEQEQFDTLTAQVEGIEARLDTLRKAQRALGQKAAEHGTKAVGTIPTSGRPSKDTPMVKFVSKQARPLDVLVQAGVVSMLSHLKRQSYQITQQERYGDNDQVKALVDSGLLLRATTNPAMTTVVGWAAELVSVGVLDLLESLQATSIFGALRSMGINLEFGNNASVKIPFRTGGGGGTVGDLRGAFVGEGEPIPVRRGTLSSVTLVRHKMAVISTYTREISEWSTPSIESLIRQGIVEDTAVAIDTALMDNVAGGAIRPAGLLNGVAGSAGTAGGDVNAVNTDIMNLLSPFITANAADGIAILLNPSKVLKLTTLSTAVGIFPFRDGVQAGTLAGFPLISSTRVPATIMVAVRAQDFASVADTPNFDTSDVATLVESDGTYPASQAMPVTTPAADKLPTPGAAAAAPYRSLFQTDSIALRMRMPMDWAMRRSGMVNQITALTW